MSNELTFYALIMMLGVFISSVSQVLLKKSAQEDHTSIIKEYINPKVIVAYMMFFGATLLSIFAYKVVPLSMGPIVEATSYIYISIFGVTVFHEKLSERKVIGLFLIIAGILVYALFGNK